MSANEQCPLNRGIYWDEAGADSIYATIPIVCERQCGKLQALTLDGGSTSTDYYVNAARLASASEIEYGGTSLQRGKGALRLLEILNVDAEDETDLYADQFPPFECPFD